MFFFRPPHSLRSTNKASLSAIAARRGMLGMCSYAVTFHLLFPAPIWLLFRGNLLLILPVRVQFNIFIFLFHLFLPYLLWLSLFPDEQRVLFARERIARATPCFTELHFF